MVLSQAEFPSRLVVLSADGMRPDFYRQPQKYGSKVPNLRELVKNGASAEAVESVYPSTTYPAHVTLVTGDHPRQHAIYSHLVSLDPTERVRPWHWFAQPIRVPALWSSARAIGKTCRRARLFSIDACLEKRHMPHPEEHVKHASRRMRDSVPSKGDDRFIARPSRRPLRGLLRPRSCLER